MWEDADDALAFSSGMSAIATLLLTFVRPGDVVVHSGPLYAATETLIAKILGQFGVSWIDFPSGATREEIDAAIADAQGQGAGLADLSRKPGQPDQPAGRCRSGRGRARRGLRRATNVRRSRSTTPSSGRCGPSRWRKGADLSIYSLTKYVGGHSDLVAGGAGRREGPDQPGAHRSATPSARSAIPTPRGCCCAASRRWNCAWTAPARMPPRSANSCAIIRRSKRSAISASSRKGRARPTFSSATAPARARPSRSI